MKRLFGVESKEFKTIMSKNLNDRSVWLKERIDNTPSIDLEDMNEDLKHTLDQIEIDIREISEDDVREAEGHDPDDDIFDLEKTTINDDIEVDDDTIFLGADTEHSEPGTSSPSTSKQVEYITPRVAPSVNTTSITTEILKIIPECKLKFGNASQYYIPSLQTLIENMATSKEIYESSAGEDANLCAVSQYNRDVLLSVLIFVNDTAKANHKKLVEKEITPLKDLLDRVLNIVLDLTTDIRKHQEEMEKRDKEIQKLFTKGLTCLMTKITNIDTQQKDDHLLMRRFLGHIDIINSRLNQPNTQPIQINRTTMEEDIQADNAIVAFEQACETVSKSLDPWICRTYPELIPALVNYKGLTLGDIVKYFPPYANSRFMSANKSRYQVKVTEKNYSGLIDSLNAFSTEAEKMVIAKKQQAELDYHKNMQEVAKSVNPINRQQSSQSDTLTINTLYGKTSNVSLLTHLEDLGNDMVIQSYKELCALISLHGDNYDQEGVDQDLLQMTSPYNAQHYISQQISNYEK